MRIYSLLLTIVLSLAATNFSFAESKSASAKSKKAPAEITIDQAEKLTQSNTNVVVLDVRTRKEFAAGHLPKATNLDFYAPDFEQQLAKLDKSKPYVVHCATGGRSAEARDKMQELGFESIYHMYGGYKGWQKAGKKSEQ